MPWDDSDYELFKEQVVATRELAKATQDLVKVEKQRNTIINKAVKEICEKLDKIAKNIGYIGA